MYFLRSKIYFVLPLLFIKIIFISYIPYFKEL